MSRLNYEYVAPKTVGEAIHLYQTSGAGTHFMAGGTDLLVKIQHRLLLPQVLIGLKKIEGLDKILFDKENGLSIGAMALLSSVAENSHIVKHYPAISFASLSTANVQIRNMGTLIGNLCNASPSADNAPTLIALDASVHMEGIKGKRSLPLCEFFKGPGITALTPGEMVTKICVPINPEGLGMAYYPLSARGSLDCSAVGVGASVVVEKDRCIKARIAVGACAPIPMRAFEAEKILMGDKLSDALIAKASEKAAHETKPISDVRASAWYRLKMVEVATARAIMEAKAQVQ